MVDGSLTVDLVVLFVLDTPTLPVVGWDVGTVGVVGLGVKVSAKKIIIYCNAQSKCMR